MSATAPFSVLILTLNEEENLPRCLASALPYTKDIVVLDSGSKDRTADIAREAGGRVYTRAFDNFGGQRNYAQRSIPFTSEWVFHLDADEQFTPELAAECARVATRRDIDGCFVAPKMLWEGKWLPHCTDYPAYQARFVRAPQFEFIQTGHGQREAPHMRLDRLKQSYLHNMSAGGEEEWLAKHRRYAKAEAIAHAADHAPVPWKQLFSSASLERRRALKRLSYTLPGRPALRFFYQYVLRRGFLDGAKGFKYCRLLARYESFAAEEARKLRRA